MCTLEYTKYFGRLWCCWRHGALKSVHDSDGLLFILKAMMSRDITTVLNERKNLIMVIRSVPNSVSLILGRTEWPGLIALHCANNSNWWDIEFVLNARVTSCYGVHSGVNWDILVVRPTISASHKTFQALLCNLFPESFQCAKTVCLKTTILHVQKFSRTVHFCALHHKVHRIRRWLSVVFCQLVTSWAMGWSLDR